MLEMTTRLVETRFSTNNTVFATYASRITNDGVIIAETYRTDTICPGDDYSNQDPRVIALCEMLHTPDNIAAFLAAMAAAGPHQTGGANGN